MLHLLQRAVQLELFQFSERLSRDPGGVDKRLENTALRFREGVENVHVATDEAVFGQCEHDYEHHVLLGDCGAL